jgi:hypothetical protein
MNVLSEIVKGRDLTKAVRHTLWGKVNGGSAARNPEIYQRDTIVKGTGIPCSKTHIRINIRTKQLEYLVCPNKKENGFDYTEDFDGLQKVEDKLIYINLKCVVGKGGSQTRTLREVYWFIEAQIHTLSDKVYYANILDGDEAYAVMDKFEYILRMGGPDIKQKIYVGDLAGYFQWFATVKDAK